jgi:hypothetical protein
MAESFATGSLEKGVHRFPSLVAVRHALPCNLGQTFSIFLCEKLCKEIVKINFVARLSEMG